MISRIFEWVRGFGLENARMGSNALDISSGFDNWARTKVGVRKDSKTLEFARIESAGLLRRLAMTHY